MSFFDFLASLFPSVFGKKAQAQSVEQQTVAQVPYNASNVEGTNMRKSVFSVMTAGEKDAAQVEYIKQQMQVKDGAGVYPYTIQSAAWTYTINRAVDKYGNDHTDEYGTQYSAMQNHK